MVRKLLVGLLIAGVTSIVVVNATAIENQNKVVLAPQPKSITVDGIQSCTALQSSANCSPASIQDTGILDFRLQNIARLFLSSSIFSRCGARSLYHKWHNNRLLAYKVGSPSKSTKPLNLQNYSPSPLNSDCILSWQNKLNQKAVTQIAPSKGIGNDAPQFPKLSRSSLIVSLPQQDSSFIKDAKLANPAPATKRIASPFGWRRRPYSNQPQFHQGIDYGAPFGSPVIAVGNGIVTKVTSGCRDFSNLFCGGQLGNWIEIDHGNGAIAVYGHLKYNSIAIKPGMKVGKNQEIAQVGSSGWSTGAHLDFRVKVNGEYEDPAKLVMGINPEQDQ